MTVDSDLYDYFTNAKRIDLNRSACRPSAEEL